MSISFEFAREPSGWRFRTDNQIDLTNWNIDYSSNRIRCTPTPKDLVIMSVSASTLFAVAIFMLIPVINPQWMFPSAQSPVRNRVQQKESAMEAMREATHQMQESYLEGKSPEEKAKFLKLWEEKAESRQRETAARRSKLESFHWILFIIRGLMILPILFMSFFGILCLERVLRYFRDNLEFSLDQESLVMRRPKLLGGVSTLVLPTRDISMISCFPRQGTHYRKVHWFVAIYSTTSLRNRLQFVVEYCPRIESLDRPTKRVRDFAEAIHVMTHAPINCR